MKLVRYIIVKLNHCRSEKRESSASKARSNPPKEWVLYHYQKHYEFRTFLNSCISISVRLSVEIAILTLSLDRQSTNC